MPVTSPQVAAPRITRHYSASHGSWLGESPPYLDRCRAIDPRFGIVEPEGAEGGVPGADAGQTHFICKFLPENGLRLAN
jgi:hypothetical protein